MLTRSLDPFKFPVEANQARSRRPPRRAPPTMGGAPGQPEPPAVSKTPPWKEGGVTRARACHGHSLLACGHLRVRMRECACV